MSVEVETPQEESDEDLMAGFSGAPTTTPETPKETTEPEAVVEATPEPKYAQITEEQLNRFIEAATAIDTIKADSKTKFDNAFGQLGGMKQVLEKLQTATPAGQPVVVTEEDMADLAEYPDLAQAQIKVLNKVLGKLNVKGTAPEPEKPAPAAFDPAVLEQMVGARLAGVQETIVDSSLNAVFPGWKQEVKTEKFGKWLELQPVEVRNLAASNDVGDAARMLQLFRSYTPTTVDPKKTTRQKQLEAAVNPKGVGGKPDHVETEDDWLMAGYKGSA